MQKRFNDLKLAVTFKHPLGQIPSRDLWKTIHHCEEAIEQSEYFDILAVARELDLPPYVNQALLWQLEESKGDIIQIEHAGEGSIFLGAVIAATAYWILNRTLGEVFVEAWKETEMRNKVKDVLLRRFGDNKNGEIIADEIKRRVESDGELNLKVDSEFRSDEESPTVVSIYIYPGNEREPAPTRAGFTFGENTEEN